MIEIFDGPLAMRQGGPRKSLNGGSAVVDGMRYLRATNAVRASVGADTGRPKTSGSLGMRAC
jgi:hypothetical protein